MALLVRSSTIPSRLDLSRANRSSRRLSCTGLISAPVWKFGTAARIAESINDLFFTYPVNEDLRAFERPGVHAAFAESQAAEVSPAEFAVRNPETGAVLKALPIPPMLLDLMLGGRLYPHLKRQKLEPSAATDSAPLQSSVFG